MPIYQKMLGRLNRLFDHPAIDDLPVEMFADDRSLSSLAFEFEVAKSEADAEYLHAIPSGMQAALRGLIVDNLRRDPRLAMTFAWAPGYDYELTVWEAPGTRVSPGGITILLRSRYPDDTHPAIRD